MQNLKGGKLNLASSYIDASHNMLSVGWLMLILFLKEMFNRVALDCAGEKRALQVRSFHFKSVSYTHLTLPTILRV